MPVANCHNLFLKEITPAEHVLTTQISTMNIIIAIETTMK